MRNIIYLLLGGNEGSVSQNFLSALSYIEKRIGEVIEKSPIYISQPWGFDSEQDFLNQVIMVKTDLSPQNVLQYVLEIENILGRKRIGSGYSSRSLDIDILFYNNLILNSQNLIIPHPRLHLRKFTLNPLNDIAPDLIHPVFKQSISQLKQNCQDNCTVKLIKTN